MPAGRPSDFDQELCDKICERIATSELGLEQVLEEIRLTDGYAPSSVAIWRWKKANQEFRSQYADAREMQAQILHDRAQQFAQNVLIGHVTRTVVTGQGDDAKTETTTTVSDNVERSKLIVQTTLKRAGQLDHKRYGERTTVAGDAENPVHIKVDREELLGKLIGNRAATPATED